MKSRKTTRERVPNRLPPARTPEKREQQLINYAVDLAEEQLRNGTASSQVITHYLKLGTEREKLNRKKLEADIKLDEAKIKQIEYEKERTEVYKEAMEKMMMYRMKDDDDFS